MSSLSMDARVGTPVPPTAAYKRMVWTALGVLVLFVVFYLGICGWFFYNAYGLIRDGEGITGFWQIAFAVASMGWGIFMLKALFFIQRGSAVKGIEVTREEEPFLFEFLDAISDQAKAPRPHRVYLSDRVNAAVSYDLSLLNVLLPSRKNLEIGLGLVNVLTLSEFRAVLAHEFGHFAQRAMAVGRWVYVVHQVAAQIVSRRDRFDNFLSSLSRSDPRIAWVAWIFQSVIWALRVLVDTGLLGTG